MGDSRYSISRRLSVLISAVTAMPAPSAPVMSPPLQGDLPSPVAPPSGCAFRTRYPLVQEICARQKPPLRETAKGHKVACHVVT